MTKPKLSREQIDEMVRLFEEDGVKPKELARRFHITVSAVNYRLLREGLDPWPQGGKADRAKQPGAFSAEDDRRMLDLGAQGLGHHKIAQMIGRPKTSVLIRILTLEVRAEKALETA